MMHMMNTTGWNAGMPLLWGAHALAMLAFVVGVLFLVLWAAKQLEEKQLKAWGIGLVIGGILVGFLSTGGMPMRGGWAGGGCFGKGKTMIDRGVMWRMGMDMEDEDDAMGMSMEDMTEMMESKTGDEFDEAFLTMMIPHHQGAIEMAQEALTSAKHPEIRRMAQEIISAQQAEIETMQGWMQAWGYEE